MRFLFTQFFRLLVTGRGGLGPAGASQRVRLIAGSAQSQLLLFHHGWCSPRDAAQVPRSEGSHPFGVPRYH